MYVGELLVVVMTFKLNDKHGHDIIVDIIDNAVVSGDMTGVSYTIAPCQRLWMSHACAGVALKFRKKVLQFFI